jgi:hypothetical protein
MLARIDEALPLLRTTCDGAMRIIIAFVADASSVCEILPTSLSRRGQPPLAGLRDRPLLSRSNGGNGSTAEVRASKFARVLRSMFGACAESLIP